MLLTKIYECPSYKTGDQRRTKTLVGNTNEAPVKLSNVAVALLDTRSCVSIIAQTFYDNYLSQVEIQPLKQILNIECADGQSLSGYVEVELEVIKGLPQLETKICLLLISKDTIYSEKTPIIIGTNILNELLDDCKQIYGDIYLQKADLHLPWYTAFRCIYLRERGLNKNKDRLAIVRSAMNEKIIIRPNDAVTIKGYTDKEMEYHPTAAIIHETEESNLPKYIDITPAIIHYENGKQKEVHVHVSNLTTNTITIPPKAILCEL